MSAETYKQVHDNWLAARSVLKALQSDHQKCLNEKAEQLEDIERRRAEFEEAAAAEVVDLDERMGQIKIEHERVSSRLRAQHARLRELFDLELNRDKGAIAAGLNGEKVRP